MKTNFELENLAANQNENSIRGHIQITGTKPSDSPFISVGTNYGLLHIKDKDLMTFLKNAAKAMGYYLIKKQLP